MRRVAEGRRNVMVAVPPQEAIEKMKSVPLDSESIITALDVGISFGDA